MAFWDDAKKKLQQFVKPKQEDERQPLSNRADGGFSGYVPKVKKDEPAQPAVGQPVGGFDTMMPRGVDPGVMQRFQPVGGQTGSMPPQGMGPQPGMPPQPQQGMPPQGQPAFQHMGYQPGTQPAQPQTGYAQQPQSAFQRFTARQNLVQQPPVAPQPMQPTPPQQPPMQTMPPQNAAPSGNTVYFPGDYVVDGNAYKLIFRVAQITGVPSCFRVIEFMYNNEAVVVNAEQVTDLVEANRCMDLIFGAACAMKQRLIRVSGKQIYLITPPQVYVAPFDSIRRMGLEDIDRRWPGALQMNMQPQAGQGMPMGQGGFAPQPRQDDFASGFGRRASRNPRSGDYTDFGGFGMRTR